MFSDKKNKYYSGSAKAFDFNFSIQNDKQYYLQLSSVKDVGIAEVTINGVDKEVVWTAPFRTEFSSELQKGENTLEIKVVYSRFNRVAGDQIHPHKKQFTLTNIHLKYDFRGRPRKEIPLESSGLLGPVTVEEAIN